MTSNGKLALETPDKAGIVRTRTKKTEEAYRQRYENLAKGLARRRDEPSVGVEDVILDLVARAPSLKKNTYYLYRASVFQFLRDAQTEGGISQSYCAALLSVLNGVDTKLIGSRVKKRRTSARRLRHVRPEVIGALVSAASKSSHPTSRNLADMIEYAPELGIRPCEFIGAKLDGTVLWIKSAKYSKVNERGLSECRPIILRDGFEELDLKIIADLVRQLNIELKAVNGDRTRLVRRYAAALRRIRIKIPAARRVTLYTARHQFCANLRRAGYTPEDIAALMGLASAETPTSHYGRANKGWRPIPAARPVDTPAALVARVRPGARAKAKAKSTPDHDLLFGGYLNPAPKSP